jgi:Flp pilus assembly protein TadB
LFYFVVLVGMKAKNVAIGLGIAGGALLAAWLLTGDRKKKTKDFVVRKTQDLKQAMKKDIETFDDSEVHYL